MAPPRHNPPNDQQQAAAAAAAAAAAVRLPDFHADSPQWSPFSILAEIFKEVDAEIIETGFAEQFYASHRMGPAPICLKIE